jgi:hypothetical protein
LCIIKLIEAAEASKKLLDRHEKHFLERFKFLEQQLNLEKSISKTESVNVEKKFDITNKRFQETMKKLKIEIDTNQVSNQKFIEDLGVRVEKCGILAEKTQHMLETNTIELNRKLK